MFFLYLSQWKCLLDNVKVQIISFIQYKRIGNRDCAYEVSSFYDKVKKRPSQKSKYLGQVDPVTKKIIHPGRKPSKEKLILNFGDSFFVTRYMQENLNEIYAFLKANNETFILKWDKMQKELRSTSRHFPSFSFHNVPLLSYFSCVVDLEMPCSQ